MTNVPANLIPKGELTEQDIKNFEEMTKHISKIVTFANEYLESQDSKLFVVSVAFRDRSAISTKDFFDDNCWACYCSSGDDVCNYIC